MPVSVGELDVRVAGDVRDAQAGLRSVVAEIVDLGQQAKPAAVGVAEVAAELTTTETASSKAAKAVASTTGAVVDLGAKAGATATKLDGVLDPVTRATRPAAAGITTVSAGLATVGERAKKAQTGVSATATAMAALGSVSGGAASRVASVGNALFTGFASGGVLGVGIAAVTAGIFALSGAIGEARQETRQFTALAAEYGTTERQVADVSEAFERTGQTLDRAVVQNLIRASSEAGTSTVELAAMADEIKRIQDLTGKDVVAAAADAAAQKAKARGEDYLAQLRAQAKAREDQQSGLAAWEVTLEEGSARDAKALDDVRNALRRNLEDTSRARAVYGEQSEEVKKLEATRRADIKERDRLSKALSEGDRLREQLSLQDAIDRGEKESAAYIASVNQRRAAAEQASRQRIAEGKRTAQEEQAAARETAQYNLDLAHREIIARAQAADDERAIVIENARFEIEQERAKNEAIKGDKQALADWIHSREAQRDSDIAAVGRREIEATRKAGQEAQAARDKALSDQEGATVAGLQVASTFVGSLRQGLQSGDALSVVKGFLGLFSGIASLAGSPVTGGVFGLVGSLFHDGGNIGTGGAPIPRFHSGGMLVAHQGLMLPQPRVGEVPIMAQLGEGVLSRKGVANAGGPSAVNALNRGEAPRMGGGNTSVYVTAFDPRSMAEVIGQVVEPVQYRRGVTRSNAKSLAGMRRAIRAPRTGR